MNLESTMRRIEDVIRAEMLSAARQPKSGDIEPVGPVVFDLQTSTPEAAARIAENMAADESAAVRGVDKTEPGVDVVADAEQPSVRIGESAFDVPIEVARLVESMLGREDRLCLRIDTLEKQRDQLVGGVRTDAASLAAIAEMLECQPTMRNIEAEVGQLREHGLLTHEQAYRLFDAGWDGLEHGEFVDRMIGVMIDIAAALGESVDNPELGSLAAGVIAERDRLIEDFESLEERATRAKEALAEIDDGPNAELDVIAERVASRIANDRYGSITWVVDSGYAIGRDVPGEICAGAKWSFFEGVAPGDAVSVRADGLYLGSKRIAGEW